MASAAPKRQKPTYDAETVVMAVEAVRNKVLGTRAAARKYGIPYSTLKDKVNGKSRIVLQATTLLSGEEELKLAEWLKLISARDFDKTPEDVCSTAEAILSGRSAASRGKSTTPTMSWFYGFMARHPELTTLPAMSLDKEPTIASPQTVKTWFDNMKAYIDSIDPTLLDDPSRIYNADETGFTYGSDIASRRFISCEGSKHMYTVSSRKAQISVLSCMSAAGHYPGPMIIYPSETIPSKDIGKGFPSAKIQCSDDGWITAPIFQQWITDVFIKNTQHIKKPILLFVDGHPSHTAILETSEACEKNGIILYCLRPLASRLIQPLDLSFLDAIKPVWETALMKGITGTGTVVTLDNFAAILRPVWKKVATAEVATSGFRAAGIHPFNPELVLSSKNLANSAPPFPLVRFEHKPPTFTMAVPTPRLPTESHHPLLALLDLNDQEPAPLKPM